MVVIGADKKPAIEHEKRYSAPTIDEALTVSVRDGVAMMVTEESQEQISHMTYCYIPHCSDRVMMDIIPKSEGRNREPSER